MIAFWHVATINNWYEIVYEQLGKMFACGLYDAADRICVGVLGDHALVRLPPKCEVAYSSPDRLEYEIATVRVLDRWARTAGAPDAEPVLYFHVKGAGREDAPSQHRVSYWRRYMEYFCIERWRDCVRALGVCDACGCDLSFSPWPHFSGNFWWANAGYLRTLPPADQLRREDPVWAELRIGESARAMSLHELWHSGRNLYLDQYPPHEYRGREPLMPRDV